MTRAEKRTSRYLELLQELRQEYESSHGSDHGWITWAAGQLGRSQGYISQILKGKPVGEGSIREAAKRRGLSEAWFHGVVEESHVEPVDEHPRDKQIREFEQLWGDRFPPYVYRMIRAGLFGRHGLTEGQLLDAAKRYQMMEEEQLAALPKIGPPKMESVE